MSVPHDPAKFAVPYDPKAKLALHYATDLTKPPSAGRSEYVQFRSWFGLLRYVVSNKAARDAIRADRFQFFRITKGK
jgi:hypothetical protein